MGQRMYLSVSHRGHRNQRHVEGVEGRIAFNEDEAQRSAGEDRDQCGADQDQPVAEAAHAVVILPAEGLSACGLTLPSCHRSVPASWSTAEPLPSRFL